MKKAILKVKLKDLEKFEKKLTEIDFDFSPIYWQHDRIYVPRGYKRGGNFPRLVMRTEMRAVDEPAKYYLILRRHIEDSGIDIVEETTVIDYQSMVNIILQLGFKPAGEVSRRRQELDMGEGIFIYLDKIDDEEGGEYAKIESPISDDDSVAEAIFDLKRTFAAFGENDIVSSAYFDEP